MEKKKENYDELTLEDLLSKLNEILKELEDEELPLEKAVELFSQGAELSKLAQNKIKNLQSKVKVIKENMDSTFSEEDMDIEQ